MVNQWGDHEVVNNWYPGEILDLPEYTEKRVDVLAARARQAFLEYTPGGFGPGPDGRIYRKIAYGPLMDLFVLDMRTFKDANGPNNAPSGGVLLGDEQREWLKRELTASTATWKIIAADLPIGLIIGDGTNIYEGIAQRENGAPLGREADIADILAHCHRGGIRNLVWLTADVHYTAAHHYSPDRAAFQDFDPFWEFVSGPLNAGSFGPGKLDATFGPQVPLRGCGWGVLAARGSRVACGSSGAATKRWVLGRVVQRSQVGFGLGCRRTATEGCHFAGVGWWGRAGVRWGSGGQRRRGGRLGGGGWRLSGSGFGWGAGGSGANMRGF